MFLVLSPIDFHILCSPSWNYPLYLSLIRRRPLPVAENAQPFDQDPDSSFTEEGEDDSEDTEPQSFIDTSSSSRSRASGSHRKYSKKKKRRSKSSRNQEDSDSDAPLPLADSIHHKRQANRLEQHPIMSGKGGNKASRASARAKKKQEQQQQQQENVQKENQQLKLELRRIQKKLKLDRTGGSGRPIVAGTNRAMQREVHKCTKQKMIHQDPNRKHGSALYKGPYTVTRVYDNGTVKLSRATANGGAVSQTWNIRKIYPCMD